MRCEQYLDTNGAIIEWSEVQRIEAVSKAKKLNDEIKLQLRL